MTRLPVHPLFNDPPPPRADATDRPDLHPDDHNALAVLIGDLHAGFPTPVDWSAIWDLSTLDYDERNWSDITGTLYRIPYGAPWARRPTSGTTDWVEGTDYDTGAGNPTYVFGPPDDTLYECFSSHTATADTEPGVGVNWTTRWRIARPVVWWMLELTWKFNTLQGSTGTRTLRVDLDPAGEFEPVNHWSGYGAAYGITQPDGDLQVHRGWLDRSSGRFEVQASGHGSGIPEYPVTLTGLVPMVRKVEP